MGAYSPPLPIADRGWTALRKRIRPTVRLMIGYGRAGSQRGIALITSVLITALISIVAVTMISEQQLDIRRTGNILDRAQAWQFALGMETIALLALRKDAENNKTDHRMEDWGKPIQFPAPDGAEGDMISGRIEDLQGRFNLNNLVNSDGLVDTGQLQQFKRLLTVLKLSPGLADRVADWIDVDSTPQGMDGAEDGEYSRQDPPYRTGNTRLVSPTELLLIVSAEEYKKLAGYVAALPGRTKTRINVNTASREVLASLDYVTAADIDELLKERERLEKQNGKGFDKIDNVLELPAFQALRTQQQEFDQYFKGCCNVASNFFLVTIFAQFDKGEVTLQSVVKRSASSGTTNQKVLTVLRTQGDY